ncbi:MAG: hypothetical protein AABX29_04305 [Nanoarchaeota archaeon]
MWINSTYDMNGENIINYFDKFRLFSEKEDREGRAVVIERGLSERKVLFNGRDGIPDFYVGMSISDSLVDNPERNKVSIDIAITDAGLIPELEQGELLDRLKGYLSSIMRLEEVFA